MIFVLNTVVSYFGYLWKTLWFLRVMLFCLAKEEMEGGTCLENRSVRRRMESQNNCAYRKELSAFCTSVHDVGTA